MKLGIQVDEPFATLVDELLLERVVRETMSALGRDEEMEIGILVTDDETVRDLNHQHRGLDETTDVLSFALGETAGEFPLPPGTPLQLGEVIISCPQARRQAQEVGHALDRELSQLLVHGLLHLLGYDHEEAAAEQMQSLERTIWKRLFP